MSAAALRLVLLLVVCLNALVARADEDVAAEPEGYRLDEYRAPTPATLRGAKVLSTEEAATIWRAHTAAFIDVLPRAPHPKGLPAGTLWRDKPRLDIPGGIWLPDTGYGELASVTLDYFVHGLEKAANGDRSKLLIFYCQANCWMSWNAAKRALALGYVTVDWYRDGTDGWSAAGLPLQNADPEPRPEP
jgi:PQQ-dependent catabolism-associated CXXCW motif protein